MMISKLELEKLINKYVDDFKIGDNNDRLEFEELGLDSLDIMDLFSELETNFNINIDDSEFSDIKSVKSLIDFLDI
jgi:acyl carrier protein